MRSAYLLRYLLAALAGSLLVGDVTCTFDVVTTLHSHPMLPPLTYAARTSRSIGDINLAGDAFPMPTSGPLVTKDELIVRHTRERVERSARLRSTRLIPLRAGTVRQLPTGAWVASTQSRTMSSYRRYP